MVAQYATKALFHHPDDDPLRGIQLREPSEQQISAQGGIEHFIREEGLFVKPASMRPREVS